ncbi:transcriptional regulator NarL [Coriobacteriaceae bacterium CHKCI002]|nr:transcriptional regulator NarL [Coriobacteriaceae bacterium CHKCI002]
MRGWVQVNRYLVAGASLYWASALVTLSFVGDGSMLGAFDTRLNGVSDILGLTTPGTALLLCVAAVCSRVFARKRVVNGIGVLIVFSALAIMGLVALQDSIPEQMLAGLLAVFRSVVSWCLIMVWGFAFASLDKQTAGQTVVITVLCSLVGYFLVMGIMTFVPAVYVVHCMYIASALILLSGKVKYADRSRKLVSAWKPRVVFFGSRAVWGLGIGLTASIAPAVDPESSLLMCALGVLTAALLLVASRYSRSGFYTALPVFPLMIAGLAFLPFLGKGPQGIAQSAVAIMWCCWIFLSSFQLSDLKETFGMNEAHLCFSEKAVVMVSWTVGAFAGASVVQLLGSQLPLAGDVFATVTTYTVVLGATYALFKLVYARRERELLDEMIRTREQHLGRLYDELAQEFGLSAREREVMEMLAQGYTRTHIKDQLVISDGTAKAHIAHVYRKLDIHKKDDLLKLVQAREANLPSSQ